MTDYRVTIKVRNARLLRAIANAGYSSIPKFSADAGVAYKAVNDLINMTGSPLLKSGAVSPIVEKIIDFLCEPFDALFTEQQCQALAVNKSERDVSAEQMYALITARDPDNPLDLLVGDTAQETVKELLSCLRENELAVLTAKYGLDDCNAKTLGVIAAERSVSTERIRQIEQKAYRKMRRRWIDIKEQST